MNVQIPAARLAVAHAALVRPAPRVRDFGIGYGRSSRYASQPRYASSAFDSRFRLA